MARFKIKIRETKISSYELIFTEDGWNDRKIQDMLENGSLEIIETRTGKLLRYAGQAVGYGVYHGQQTISKEIRVD